MVLEVELAPLLKDMRKLVHEDLRPQVEQRLHNILGCQQPIWLGNKSTITC